MNEPHYEGSCLCGRIKLEVKGPPLTEGFCHCESCRTWHAAPLNAWALWKSENFKVIEGEELLEGYDTKTSHRYWCRRCGSSLFNQKPSPHVVVYARVLASSGYVHTPSCHIHCIESVLEINDGLPRYEDLPREWGGSGIKV